MVPSLDALASPRPSGVNATADTGPAWSPTTNIVNSVASRQRQILKLEFHLMLQRDPAVIGQLLWLAELGVAAVAEHECALHRGRRAVDPIEALRLELLALLVGQFDPLVQRVGPGI